MNYFVKKRTRIIAFSLCVSLLFLALTGCGKKEEEEVKETIYLSVWVGDNNAELAGEAIEEFKAMYPEEDFAITVSVEPENSCRTTVLQNIDLAADVYTFVDDQFSDLYNAGALLEITENADEVIAAAGGTENAGVQACMVGEKLYAYPQSAGNTYYLYYNKKYYSEEDVKTLESILDIAKENGKYFAMDFANGWYLYSFFKAAGMDVVADETGAVNTCDWNRTKGGFTGKEVTERLLEIASHEGFCSMTNDQMLESFQNGEVIACVNGPWSVNMLTESMGSNLGVVKLPTYHLKNKDLQMCSFFGYKLVGVNARSRNPLWAMRLAQYLTGESVDLKRFEVIGECPANENAAQSEEVKASPVASAIAAQAEFGYIQRVANPFWEASTIFGTAIAGQNPDGKDIQELLDETVERITATPDDADEE